MKAINKIFMGMGLLAMGSLFGSCIGDLDVPVKDPNQLTPEEFAKDPDAYLNRGISEVFQGITTSSPWGEGSSILGFGDAGAGTFSRTVFNIEEMSTDNYSWLQFNDAGYYELVTMNLDPNNEIVYMNYSRLYSIIALCNQFIRTVNSGAYLLEGNADRAARAADYVRQAKVVRGLAYYYAISAYGNIGYIDESAPAGTAPTQYSREDAFNMIVSSLEDVSEDWGASYTTPAYGYVGKEACDALLTRFYLNAETWTGTPMYDKCWTLCQKIIANHAGGYENSGLADSYKALFGANNYEYAAQGARTNEIIWTLPQESMSLKSYGNSTFYIASVCGSYDGISSIGDCNLTEQWNCMVARQQLSEMFGFDKDGYSLDLRAELWKTSKDGFVIDNNTIVGNAGYGQGYAPLKWTNYAYDEFGNIDEDATPVASSFASADWPEIRLAEVYLNAAEAQIIGGAGSQNEALKYINFIRGRAGVDPWGVADMTADNILTERDRELYGENDRRTALVRHGKYAGGAYLWNWKGGTQHGTATPEHMNLFPIPIKVISFSKYKQNPGY